MCVYQTHAYFSNCLNHFYIPTKERKVYNLALQS